jgi:hypothetical protein
VSARLGPGKLEPLSIKDQEGEDVNSMLKTRVAQVGLVVAGGAATAAIGLGTSVASTPSTHHDTGNAASSIVATTQNAAAPDSKLYHRTELYFGTSHTDHSSPVTVEQFQGFVDSEVTPQFPDGLTLLDGHGQWRDESGTIQQENSHELILLYPLNDRTASKKIEYIRTKYKHDFHQESVLRDDSYDQVSF